MTTQPQKDTSPIFGHAPRYHKTVTIKQVNEFMKSWDTTAIYPSDDLPEWFQGLQSIVEDMGFQQMTITLGSSDGTGGKVEYHITAEHNN